MIVLNFVDFRVFIFEDLGVLFGIVMMYMVLMIIYPSVVVVPKRLNLLFSMA